MNATSLLGHCAEVLGQIIRSRSTPADALVSSYTRQRKYLGAKERRALSEITFATLRTLNTAEHILGMLVEQYRLPMPPKPIAALMGASAAVAPHWADFDAEALLNAASGNRIDPAEALSLLYHQTTTATLPQTWQYQLLDMLSQIDATENHPDSVAWKACLPVWIVEHLAEHGISYAEIVQLGRALIYPAPVVLRAASPAIDRDALLDALRREDIPARPTLYSPDGIVLEQRVQLLDHKLYRNGFIEIQDEGSQIVGYALDPEPHWRILDACAGAGGKTLHLARIQNDSGHIIASDTDPARLRNLRRRLSRHRFRSIQIEMLARVPTATQRALQDTFDAVLVDAPCSGTGTLRRAPEIKWRIQPWQLERIIAKQELILRTYAPYVRSGGVLLYATCSLLPGENEKVIERFLDQHPDFEPDEIAPSLSRWGIHLSLSEAQWSVQLLPHRHNTDGFFIARLRRR